MILKEVVEYQKSNYPIDYSVATITTASVANRVAWKQKQSINLKTYSTAITQKGITEHMAAKCAGSSLTYQDLKNVCRLHGLNGFMTLFTSVHSSNGKPRITKATNVIKKLFKYINKE